jgi:Protein of unknown function (DUF3253)
VHINTVSEQTLIEAEILRLTEASGPDKSICPTEVAHAVMPGEGDAWRQKLSAVRRAAVRLAQEGRIDILRKGKPVDPLGVKGVIRLRVRPAGAAPAFEPTQF